MRRWIALMAVGGASLLAVTNAAQADRIYSSMEKCNAKCHGVCFMEAEGAHCYWGALKKPARKVEPKLKPVVPKDGKGTPRN